MIDFHVHCDYSVDAEGSVEDYTREALTRGLRQICFTTHCDLDPSRRHHDGRVRLKGEIVDVTSAWLDSYLSDIRKAAAEYRAKGLKVLCGLEIGYTPGIESMIESVIAVFPFDFILGGVHTLSGIDIVSSGESVNYFKERTPRQVCEEYYSDLNRAVRCGLFDCIAHIDIYKRCGLDFYGDTLSTAHRGLVEPVLDELAKRELALEINSGGLRKGLPWPYPSPDILKIADAAGIVSVTPGSDCHRPDQVGYGVDRCLEVALGGGFDRIAVFEGRSRQYIPIEEIYEKERKSEES